MSKYASVTDQTLVKMHINSNHFLHSCKLFYFNLFSKLAPKEAGDFHISANKFQ